MPSETQHIAPGVGQRIEPAPAIVDDDDNLSTAPGFHHPTCAFFQIDRKTRLFQHNDTRDTIPQVF